MLVYKYLWYQIPTLVHANWNQAKIRKENKRKKKKRYEHRIRYVYRFAPITHKICSMDFMLNFCFYLICYLHLSDSIAVAQWMDYFLFFFERWKSGLASNIMEYWKIMDIEPICLHDIVNNWTKWQWCSLVGYGQLCCKQVILQNMKGNSGSIKSWLVSGPNATI